MTGADSSMWPLLLSGLALADPVLLVDLDCPGLASSRHALLAYDVDGNEVAAAVVREDADGRIEVALTPSGPVHSLALTGATCELRAELELGSSRVFLGVPGSVPPEARCAEDLAALLAGGFLDPPAAEALRHCARAPEERAALIAGLEDLRPEVRTDPLIVELLGGPELQEVLLRDLPGLPARHLMVGLHERSASERGDPPWLHFGGAVVVVSRGCSCPAERTPSAQRVGEVLVIRPDSAEVQAIVVNRGVIDGVERVVCGCVSESFPGWWAPTEHR